MEDYKKEVAHQEDTERDEVNWPVVLPILIVMALAVLYIFLF